MLAWGGSQRKRCTSERGKSPKLTGKSPELTGGYLGEGLGEIKAPIEVDTVDGVSKTAN